MQALMKEFRTFLLRGNLVDMAVGIVIGIAFAALVTAFVADIITPIIAAIAGKHDFSSLTFTIHKSRFLYGAGGARDVGRAAYVPGVVRSRSPLLSS